MKKIIVDQDKCIGCGACVGCEPNVFEFNDDGLAYAKKSDFDKLDDNTKESVRDAVSGCPTEAISVKE